MKLFAAASVLLCQSITAPVPEQRELVVRDGETGEPQPGATVLFIGYDVLTPPDLTEELLREHDGDPLLVALATAEKLGRKWENRCERQSPRSASRLSTVPIG